MQLTTDSNSDINFFLLLWQTSLVAKIVLFLLLSASIFCWGIILSKIRLLRLAERADGLFLEVFWNGKTLDEIFVYSQNHLQSLIANSFRAAINEFIRLEDTGLSPEKKLNNLRRAFQRAAAQDISDLESSLGWLASTASTAPFLGLFGTVWGIMSAFQSIGASGGASLAVVAPGISEALITTALGIAVAIPAVLAYNYLSHEIRRVMQRIEGFSLDLTNFLQRKMALLEQSPLGGFQHAD